MRFSEIKGERVLDVICELIEPITNISLDKGAADIFCTRILPEGEDKRAFALKRLAKSYPALMNKHRDDIVHIMATLDGVTDEEYLNNLSMPILINSLGELIIDPYFRSFFVSTQTDDKTE